MEIMTRLEAGGDPDRLLTYKELAELCQVPERTIRHWCNTGAGPRVVQLGRHRRVRLADVRDWLNTRYAA